MVFSKARCFQPEPLLVCTQPLKWESWGGYLLRLAGANCCRGIRDLGSVLGLSEIDLLKADPVATAVKLGIKWKPTLFQSHLLRRKTSIVMPKLFFVGRSMTFRFCPHCLTQDRKPHIRAGWEGPISLACRHHGVALISQCYGCGETPSYRQRSHLVCECGVPYASQIPRPVPKCLDDFEKVFPEAAQSMPKDTFAGSTELEREVSAIAHWMMEPLDPTTGQRKPKVKHKHRPLDLDVVQAIGLFLVDWPIHAIDLIRMEYECSATNPMWILKRRLCAKEFGQMDRLLVALEERSRLDQAIWQEANREILTDFHKEAFSLREVHGLTGIELPLLNKLFLSGRIPHVRRRSVKTSRYHGLEVPAHVYWCIAQDYRQTNSSKSLLPAPTYKGSSTATDCSPITSVYKVGNAEDKKFRIAELLPKCKTQIIAIDDFQDVPARRGQHGVKAVGDWVRDLFEIRFTGTIMAFGTEAAAVVRDSNIQLGRRMMSRMDLPVFNMSTEKIRVEFRSLLRRIDASIPLAMASGLEKPDLMAKLFFASGGNFDYLMKLITHAMIRAVRGGRESISAGDLEAGFKDLHQVAALQGNPFSDDFNGKPLDAPGQIFHRPPEIVNDERAGQKSRSSRGE